ncbi:MAG: hypothetical protein ABI378_01340 [Chitinophagaceae bacterium]
MPNIIKACLLKVIKAISPEPQKPQKHWIKFSVKDDKGKPMSGVSMKVTLPDDSIEEVTSDDKGLISITNIDPGSCKVKLDWKGKIVNNTVFIQ